MAKQVIRGRGAKGGSERIRTAVGAFAELCPATRRRNRFVDFLLKREAKLA